MSTPRQSSCLCAAVRHPTASMQEQNPLDARLLSTMAVIGPSLDWEQRQFQVEHREPGLLAKASESGTWSRADRPDHVSKSQWGIEGRGRRLFLEGERSTSRSRRTWWP
eukprot:2958262-Rhodomonas_salina.1